MEVHQRGELLQLDADRAVPVEEGSYRWRGELRLWDNEALIGWYRSTDAAVRSKGSLYLALHGTHAWGRWVGMSYDGAVITGWGAIARTEEEAGKVVQDLIDSETLDHASQ
jgi:phage terminase Nu1 subunit (DNA packaging protein)